MRAYIHIYSIPASEHKPSSKADYPEVHHYMYQRNGACSRFFMSDQEFSEVVVCTNHMVPERGMDPSQYLIPRNAIVVLDQGCGTAGFTFKCWPFFVLYIYM